MTVEAVPKPDPPVPADAPCRAGMHPELAPDERQGIIRIDQGWLITFADLMALLLSFFVMLYGMSVMQTEAWQSIVSSLSDELSAGHDAALVRQMPQQTPLREISKQGDSLTYLQTILGEKFRNDPVMGQLTVHREGGRLSVIFPADLLFGSRSHVVLAERSAAISILAESLRGISNRIELHATIVVADTESSDVAFDHGWYWRLGIARALAMVSALKDVGFQRTILPYGHVEIEESPGRGLLALVIHEDG